MLLQIEIGYILTHDGNNNQGMLNNFRKFNILAMKITKFNRYYAVGQWYL